MSDASPAVARWSGSSPAIVLAHATGFCKEIWGPVVDELRVRRVDSEIIAFDQRGHGDSPPIEGNVDWWNLGDDALAAAGGGTSLIGVGHSSGGTALLMAELLRPGTFAALILVEPVVFPPPHARDADSPLAAGALRRKASFPSRRAALENFRGRGPFAGWDERALEAYVDGGTRRQGGALALKCRPEVEAEFYRSGSAHGVWERLGEIGARCLLVAGEFSGIYSSEFAAAQAQRLGARLEIVPGASHFFPMQQPERLAEIIATELATPDR